MRSKTAGSASSTTTTINEDDHRHGLYALSPLALLGLVLVSGGAWFIFSTLQVTSTEQSVFGLLQIGVQLPPNLTATQVMQYVNGQLDRYQTIAFAIGWGVQIALLMLSFPPDNALKIQCRAISLSRQKCVHDSEVAHISDVGTDRRRYPHGFFLRCWRP